ncbi:MAG: biopolymer transporter ExbB [gamma proteobacterium symbiont of Ctena orbiculata]|uniref:MotA/TolQ/ExbB proton channel family protein n=1 Tax=Candidatus Thiodiazotropha taylori TaxID=2792791 RepID=A0A944M9P7_9GAMM|nr:MotA/TolQ/ExbB proton channel family protein [Candidatus Thiodiazotropha taylori]PUB83055.1 MAG: biopolymer transporter ExbB [gamma proteobacterium symbiont of Ctena orbiculata]MBT2990551.1 MotA/TolQ/ExbB proton channel family protein [Candidatus Thiodiazotropha taylori]MBT2998154.1 MotA/TolQ/ExbB proton channel family protein [Candidatus Thiodiazotropha taylori]MBT3002453.1 MotA/TolQ/ExbB proton channel family protein [Candidatus Thiodiazotropha taylori]
MLELVKSGGWLMLPIIACSIVALGIVIERFWSLQRKRVMPDYLMRQILQLHRDNKLNLADLDKLKDSSPLGRILAAGLINRDHNKEVMKEAIEEVGRQVVHELERYLNTLGTIASISPLLGLLGTVIGMIKVFSVIVTAGVGDPGVLAGGISEALITTAAGLSVAIPSLMFHRYFSGLIDRLVIGMEEQALKLVEVIHGERELR